MIQMRYKVYSCVGECVSACVRACVGMGACAARGLTLGAASGAWRVGETELEKLQKCLVDSRRGIRGARQ